jgi:KDO2-lipid IV(A) lauroyltransferase
VPELPDRTVAAYRLGSALARGLPGGMALWASKAMGAGAAGTMRDRRVLVERNLRRVYGPDFGGVALRRSVQQTFDYYARYWVESFRLPDMTAAQLDDGMAFEGYEHIDAAIERGIGPILAIPHLGGWEWAAFWMARVQHTPVAAVVEPLEPPELFEWFVAFRESLGMKVIPLGPHAGTAVMQSVRNADVMCLLSDRDIEGNGVEVEFFGEVTTLPAGPATLALRTGAPLLPTAIYFRGRGHHAVIRPPIPTERRGRLRDDVSRVTQLMASELEALIRAEPEQWHMMQPNWPSDREVVGRPSGSPSSSDSVETSRRPRPGTGP